MMTRIWETTKTRRVKLPLARQGFYRIKKVEVSQKYIIIIVLLSRKTLTKVVLAINIQNAHRVQMIITSSIIVVMSINLKNKVVSQFLKRLKEVGAANRRISSNSSKVDLIFQAKSIEVDYRAAL